jgi:hypothetical protein
VTCFRQYSLCATSFVHKVAACIQRSMARPTYRQTFHQHDSRRPEGSLCTTWPRSSRPIGADLHLNRTFCPPDTSRMIQNRNLAFASVPNTMAPTRAQTDTKPEPRLRFNSSIFPQTQKPGPRLRFSPQHHGPHSSPNGHKARTSPSLRSPTPWPTLEPKQTPRGRLCHRLQRAKVLRYSPSD